MDVVKTADKEVADKIDTQYVSAQFPHVENTCINFLCTLDDREEDEWIDDKGKHYFVIRLPYDMVKQSTDIRAFMVAIVKERLGEVA
jgi:hypothetical protein